MPIEKYRAESLQEQAQDVHEEARMVLPGVQALFGFQLIAAFNQRFDDLDKLDQHLHFLALLLIAAAIGLIMAPAAYHRLCERGGVSSYFTNMASRLIAAAMVPLALAISLDIYVVGQMIFPDVSRVISIGAAAIVFLYLAILWFAFPLSRRDRAVKEKA